MAAYAVLMLIVLLNLLIAVVSFTFHAVKAGEEAHMLRNHAVIIAELEALMDEAERRELNEGGLGRFLHVLEPRQAAHWLLRREQEQASWGGKLQGGAPRFGAAKPQQSAQQVQVPQAVLQQVQVPQAVLQQLGAALQEQLRASLQEQLQASLQDQLGRLQEEMRGSMQGMIEAQTSQVHNMLRTLAAQQRPPPAWR